ncbi:hypothetical protein MBAV_006340 [Candidatus Magnetobacterium bavaricum]|uniref:Membrane protein containing DUF389 n=1 Tax=Candidatus Magnetobacterium bavaricum TaxID=29290 RepID=A0A0F3GLB1_9BACT|nr:hypothetical protein MBAV_006340 [Candidatus Magnetobacterium bavaricum]
MSLINQWLADKRKHINYDDVISSVYREVEPSTGYFFQLVVANFIALTGLLTNSGPVIIGAMLISPLMSPILNVGFAFITADRFVWRKSLIIIGISITATILLSATATYLSPLNDVTSEIIARTKPNVYDLIVAFLSGIVGAHAICTKKNYLTIVPGVAIATAVIPPLSVTGYGIGVYNLDISMGGFFLFFTNFVAIIISTCWVFFFYGFSPALISNVDVSVKKRLVFLFIILWLISVPLVYTLKKSILEIKDTKEIHKILQDDFNKTRKSRLVSFTYKTGVDGKLEVNAVVNTVDYIKDVEVENVVKRLKLYLKKDTDLYVEQVKVQPGGLKDEVQAIPKPPVVVSVPQRHPADIVRQSKEDILRVIKETLKGLEGIISPSPILDFSVVLDARDSGILFVVKSKRDKAFSDEELLFLDRWLSNQLKLNVRLKIDTEPFVQPLLFKRWDSALSDEMSAAILTLKDVYGRTPGIKISVEAFPEHKNAIKQSQQRLRAVREILTAQCNIPADVIESKVSSQVVKLPIVRITVVSSQETVQQ